MHVNIVFNFEVRCGGLVHLESLILQDKFERFWIPYIIGWMK